MKHDKSIYTNINYLINILITIIFHYFLINLINQFLPSELSHNKTIILNSQLTLDQKTRFQCMEDIVEKQKTIIN